MEFRYDPQARRLRMRALVPAGHHAESFVATNDFKFGIEEEYFLSDAKTFAVPAETPDELFETADFGVSGRIEREFLQAQIEVATEPQFCAGDARAALLRLRQNASAAAAEHGLVVLACGTHPLARWREFGAEPEGSLFACDGRAADDRAARHAVRHACACRVSGSAAPHRRDDADHRLIFRSSSRCRRRRRSGRATPPD